MRGLLTFLLGGAAVVAVSSMAKGKIRKKLKYGGDPQDYKFLEMYVKVTYNQYDKEGGLLEEKGVSKGWITVNDVYSDDEMYDEIKSDLGIDPEDITDVEILKENIV